MKKNVTVNGKVVSLNVKMRADVRTAEKLLYQTSDSKAFEDATSWMSAESCNELRAAAKAYHEAKVFFESYKGNKFLVEHLRDGYIGMKVEDARAGTTYWQTSRGRPYGTLVAISASKIGISYIGKDEAFTDPLIGQYIAFQRAMGNEPNPYVSTRALAQYRHFVDRSLRYFEPTTYSVCKGITPLADPNHDTLMKIRELILGPKANISKKSAKK
jgi:hypothetical protein